MATTILATEAYRSKVAAAAATGGSLPKAAEIAFGTGTTPPSTEDIGLESEVHRQVLDSAEADGMMLICKGVLQGEDSGDSRITETGVFAEDGTLMGRRVFKPKELEPESDLEFTLEFQY